MCMTNRVAVANRMKARKRKTGQVIAYKVVEIPIGINTKTLFNIIRSPSFCNFLWKPGTTKAQGKLVNRSKQLCGRVGPGIHVYRNKKAALAGGYMYYEINDDGITCRTYNSIRVIIRLTANIKDLLGANDTQAVFRKVKLTQAEYSKAMAKAKERYSRG